MATFVQSIAINCRPGESITLHADQISGLGYTLQEIIDRIKLADTALSAARAQDNGDAHSGAMAGMNALRNIERIAERTKRSAQDSDGLSMDEWWRIHDDAVGAMRHAAGKHDVFMAGFLATVAGYHSSVFLLRKNSSICSAGTP
jgi:hypothetical protein